MEFYAVLDQVIDLLRQRGRVTYRALKLQFGLDDEQLEALKEELLYAQHLAVDEANRVLVWAGDPDAMPTPNPTAPPASVSAPPPSPEQGRLPLAYTPSHLAEKILTSRSALEGERKQVTVLFADLKGSMELLADRDPEEARQLLDPVLERMMAAVHRYEGTVNQVMGDGIMALFGAPIAHEDHAAAGLLCRPGHAGGDPPLQRGGAPRRMGSTVHIRVGLNSGEVVVRAIGNDLHMDYSAIGQTTHLAARMEQLAPPGSIRLTAETLRLVEGFVQVNPLGPVPVKGLSAPVEVFELVGAGPARTRLQALPPGGSRASWGGRRSWTALAPGPGAGRCGPWSGRGGHWGGRRGQVPSVLRVHPCVAHPGLAPARKQRGLLWQGHAVPPGHRPAQGLLSDRRPRRWPAHPREGHRAGS